MEPKRILVLTASTGGGHDARADAFEKWFQKIYASNVHIKVENLLENSSKTGNFGIDFYNWIQKKAPIVEYFYWYLIECLGHLNYFRVLFGRSYYIKLLKSFKPHIIFSVHDFLNIGYFQLAKKILGKENVRCMTYCSEFSGGFGYSKNWLNSKVDWYISKTTDAEKFALKHGIKKENSYVFNAFFLPKIFEDSLDSSQKKDFIKNELNLNSQKFTIFFATGGNGAQNPIPFLESISHLQNIQAIINCGNNKESHATLLQWKKSNPNLPVHIEGYSNRMHLLIQASEIMIAKGGANTASQALHFGCPIIFNNLKILMPQEWATIRFFKKNQACIVIKSLKKFSSTIEHLLTNPDKFNQLKNNMLALRPPTEDPYSFFQKIYNLAPS